ncbi:MAG: cation:proton antiporter [Acidobacteria bacterium]|nr:cation:proton antiporter [Acidobacteriota bacterium]
MDHSAKLLLDLFLIFAAGKLLAEIFERLRQPPVVGEIIAGVLLGRSLLGWVQPSEMLAGLAEIGVIFLLFTIGLETRSHDLLRVGRIAALVAALGVVVPFALGFSYLKALGHPDVESVFLGAALVATSVGITARVLKDAGALFTRAAQVILGAAVLDDILGMIVLAIVTSLSAGETHYMQLVIVATEAIGFTVLMVLFGSRLVGRLEPAVPGLRSTNPAFVLSILLCLGLSLASVYIGMAAIIGAFLAGLALADHSAKWRLHEKVQPVYEFLTPFFFVYLGTQVNVRTLAQRDLLGMLGVVCLLAIASKLTGCGLASLGLGWKDALRVGVGMVPRGEVGLIVAAVGLRLHTISDRIYTVVLLMSMITTLVAPPLLRLLFPAPSPPVTMAANE